MHHLLSIYKKIDRTTMDGAEDLDLGMLMYNLLEYSLIYSDTKSSLWFHLKDEETDFSNNI